MFNFNRGIKMWLLSQAEYLEVLSPPEFKAEIADTIARMNKIYCKPKPPDVGAII